MDMDTGILTLTFSETIDETNIVWTGMRLHQYAKSMYGTVYNFIEPTVAPGSLQLSNILYVKLGATDMASLKKKEIGVSSETLWLSLDAGAFKDMAGLPVVQNLETGVTGGSSMTATTLVLDQTGPTIEKWRIDRTGDLKNIIKLWFSEPVAVSTETTRNTIVIYNSTLDSTAFKLGSAAGEGTERFWNASADSCVTTGAIGTVVASQTLTECKALCEADAGCLAFEYGGENSDDCQLRSSSDSAGCIGTTTVYVKEDKDVYTTRLDYVLSEEDRVMTISTGTAWSKLLELNLMDETENTFRLSMQQGVVYDLSPTVNSNEVQDFKIENKPECGCTEGAGYFVNTRCTTIDDAVCGACTACGDLGQYYEHAACSTFLDTQCLLCDSCDSGYYPSSVCADTQNTVCGVCTTCNDMEYETNECTGGVNRICATCKVCVWMNAKQEAYCISKQQTWKNENCCFDKKGAQIKCKSVDFANLEIDAKNGRHHWVFPDSTPLITGFGIMEWSGD